MYKIHIQTAKIASDCLVRERLFICSTRFSFHCRRQTYRQTQQNKKTPNETQMFLCVIKPYVIVIWAKTEFIVVMKIVYTIYVQL